MINITADLPGGGRAHLRFTSWAAASHLIAAAAAMEGALLRDPRLPDMGPGEILLAAQDVVLDALQADVARLRREPDSAAAAPARAEEPSMAGAAAGESGFSSPSLAAAYELYADELVEHREIRPETAEA